MMTSAIAAITMAAFDEAVGVALAAPPIELAKPSDEYAPYVEMTPQGILITIVRYHDYVVHAVAQTEFRVISVDMFQHQALAFSEYIFDKAGVDPTSSAEQSL